MSLLKIRDYGLTLSIVGTLFYKKSIMLVASGILQVTLCIMENACIYRDTKEISNNILLLKNYILAMIGGRAFLVVILVFKFN